MADPVSTEDKQDLAVLYVEQATINMKEMVRVGCSAIIATNPEQRSDALATMSRVVEAIDQWRVRKYQEFGSRGGL